MQFVSKAMRNKCFSAVKNKLNYCTFLACLAVSVASTTTTSDITSEASGALSYIRSCRLHVLQSLFPFAVSLAHWDNTQINKETPASPDKTTQFGGARIKKPIISPQLALHRCTEPKRFLFSFFSFRRQTTNSSAQPRGCNTKPLRGQAEEKQGGGGRGGGGGWWEEEGEEGRCWCVRGEEGCWYFSEAGRVHLPAQSQR